MKVTLADAYSLMVKGQQALAEVESNGIRVDVGYLQDITKKIQERIKKLQISLKEDKVWKLWLRRFGDKANLGSRVQMGVVLFDELGHSYPGGKDNKTATGRYKTDDTTLSDVKDPFVKRFLRVEKLKKAKSTYLDGLFREVVDGYVHPVFNLHLVDTFRGCVAKGTLIEAVRDVSIYPKGIPIECVEEGDYVYCYDNDLNLCVKKVLWSGKTGRKNVLRVHWDSGTGKGGYVDLTPEHRVRMANGCYVEARILEDNLNSQVFSDLLVLGGYKIVKIEKIDLEVDVYDLQVSGFHNFIANEICVHNSCDSPNVQNVPARDEEFAEIVRKCYIPRKGRVFVERDFGALEFRIIAAVWKDPKMIEYVSDPKKDIHRDMAARCYLLKPEEVSRDVRYCGKNGFVFPRCYGSFYKQIAKNMWLMIDDKKLTGPNGIPMKEHLRFQGICKLGKCDPSDEYTLEKGSFEKHIKTVEDWFFEEFSTYRDTTRQWINDYRKRGWFQTVTGFVLKGLYSNNFLLNAPIQGCLAGSSKVLTEDYGWVPIQNLVGKCVRVWTGFNWAYAVGLDKGVWQRARIYLSSGLVVECDTRHKLKNELDQWVDFQDLKVGGLVALSKCSVIDSYVQEIDWSFVFGFIVGDGCLQRIGDKTRILSITVGNKKRDTLIAIRKFLESHGFKTRWREIPPKDNRARKYILYLQNCFFADFLEENGFDFRWKAKTKKIPSSIWGMSREDRRSFLEGLWAADGARLKWQERNLHMCNKGLLKEVQILMSDLGFDSRLCETKHGYLLRIHVKKKRASSPRKYPLGTLKRLVGSVSFCNYKDECEYVSDYRNFANRGGSNCVGQDIAERIVARSGEENAYVYRYDIISRIEILDKEEITYTMSVDDPLHQFVADGVIHKNSGFHLLLWSLIRTQKELRKRRMKSLIVAHVHDCLLVDTPENEIEDVLELTEQIMTRDVRKAMTWLGDVPLEVEAEIASPTWFHKKPWIKDNGVWGPVTGY